MRCYFCFNQSQDRFCQECSLELESSFELLPSMPNICLGGYLYSYSMVIRKILHEVKFRSNYRLMDVLRDHILKGVLPPIFFDSDAIVLVRSHWLRQLFRGKFHLQLLFQPLVHQMGFELDNYIIRSRYSRSSYLLNRYQRKQAHEMNRFIWKGPSTVRSVTILDDICTTGSTVIEIARLLKSLGVDTVKVLVITYVETNSKIKRE